jgi:hypothetical protein
VGDLAKIFIRESIINVSEFGGRLEANSICVSRIEVIDVDDSMIEVCRIEDTMLEVCRM